MEDMEIDDVVIPDTPPDKLAARHAICRESVGRVCNSPLACNLSNSDFGDEKSVNGPRVKDRFIYENGHTRRLVIRPPRNPGNLAIKSGSNSYVLSSGDNSSASQNADLFRRPAVGRNSSCEAKHSSGTEKLDKGKSISIKTSSKSSAFPENTEVLDLTEQNGHTQLCRKVFPHGKLEDVSEGTRNRQITSVGSSTDCTENHLERSRNANKAKEKIDDSTYNGLGFAASLGKGVDLPTEPQHKTGHQKPLALHSFTLPRVSGQKRLVRNGCISPNNIATRSKQLDVEHNNSSKNIEQSHAVNAVSNGSPHVIDVSDMVSEDNKRERLKGKGVIVQSSTSKENNARVVHTSTSLLNDNNEANRTSHTGKDISGCSERICGWRSTRNRSRTLDPLLSDSTEHLPRMINGAGNYVNQHGNRVEGEGNFVSFADNLNSTQTASTLVSEPGRMTGQRREGKRVIKREKKRGLNMGNHGECSTLDNGDSDILFLGSSETSESSKSSRIQRPQFQGMLRPVIEVDELSPAAGPSAPQGINSMNDDSEARARQLEADEMLARELQEQLYHEVPAFGGGEQIDEHLAWALQQEENASGRHDIPHSRGSSMLHSHRQPQSQSSQNPSTRRGTQARVPSSSTMAQLRSRLRNQAPRVSNRRRNLRVPFPSDMDLDMRLNILEALEAAVGDVGGDVGLNNNMFRLQRDFNANDYEMLLALDENNHQLGGATVNQINNLPQSTVQTDASEEACAICLETPTRGETVRHLPCLHRFHKDCIDPWLNRKTSCPVCKCSIS
ncbi:hypothetical protein M0R45_018116 [Rubus argutus]|uniref:RING-type domain-containing protein n=1 Tax=Rubus argutus TaxID=59490 RepID=A0AAW1X452_RUBAR